MPGKMLFEFKPVFREVTDAKEKQLLRMLVDKFHRFGCPKNIGIKKPFRWFVTEDEYTGAYMAVAVIQPPNIKTVLQKAKVKADWKRSYFIRRICHIPPFRGVLVQMLTLLAEQLKREGKECLYSFSYPDTQGKIYQLAGFKRGYVNARGYTMWYMLLQR